MVCPFCLHKSTRVYNSRTPKKINEVWRRRQCEACKKQFTTREHAQPGKIISVRDGTKHVPFLQSKLLLSLLRACDHRADDGAIFYLLDTIQQRLYALANAHQAVTPQEIAAVSLETLQNFDPVAYIKYSANTGSAPDITHLLRKQKPRSS